MGNFKKSEWRRRLGIGIPMTVREFLGNVTLSDAIQVTRLHLKMAALQNNAVSAHLGCSVP